MMKQNFQIHPIDTEKVNRLFQLTEKELSEIGATRLVANEHPGFPCRVSLQDAEVGEEVILFPFKHHDVSSPYQASGPVFIRKNAVAANLKINEIPLMLNHRFLSVRAYNEKGFMIAAETCEGNILSGKIEMLFENIAVAYLHIHNAGPGCYNCRVERIK